MPIHDELDGIDESTIGQAIPWVAASLRVCHKARRVCTTSGELAATARLGVFKRPGDESKAAPAEEGLLEAASSATVVDHCFEVADEPGR